MGHHCLELTPYFTYISHTFPHGLQHKNIYTLCLYKFSHVSCSLQDNTFEDFHVHILLGLPRSFSKTEHRLSPPSNITNFSVIETLYTLKSQTWFWHLKVYPTSHRDKPLLEVFSFNFKGPLNWNDRQHVPRPVQSLHNVVKLVIFQSVHESGRTDLERIAGILLILLSWGLVIPSLKGHMV